MRHYFSPSFKHKISISDMSTIRDSVVIRPGCYMSLVVLVSPI